MIFFVDSRKKEESPAQRSIFPRNVTRYQPNGPMIEAYLKSNTTDHFSSKRKSNYYIQTILTNSDHGVNVVEDAKKENNREPHKEEGIGNLEKRTLGKLYNYYKKILEYSPKSKRQIVPPANEDISGNIKTRTSSRLFIIKSETPKRNRSIANGSKDSRYKRDICLKRGSYQYRRKCDSIVRLNHNCLANCSTYDCHKHINNTLICTRGRKNNSIYSSRKSGLNYTPLSKNNMKSPRTTEFSKQSIHKTKSIFIDEKDGDATKQQTTLSRNLQPSDKNSQEDSENNVIDKVGDTFMLNVKDFFGPTSPSNQRIPKHDSANVFKNSLMLEKVQAKGKKLSNASILVNNASNVGDKNYSLTTKMKNSTNQTDFKDDTSSHTRSNDVKESATIRSKNSEKATLGRGSNAKKHSKTEIKDENDHKKFSEGIPRYIKKGEAGKILERHKPVTESDLNETGNDESRDFMQKISIKDANNSSDSHQQNDGDGSLSLISDSIGKTGAAAFEQENAISRSKQIYTNTINHGNQNYTQHNDSQKVNLQTNNGSNVKADSVENTVKEVKSQPYLDGTRATRGEESRKKKGTGNVKPKKLQQNTTGADSKVDVEAKKANSKRIISTSTKQYKHADRASKQLFNDTTAESDDEYDIVAVKKPTSKDNDETFYGDWFDTFFKPDSTTNQDIQFSKSAPKFHNMKRKNHLNAHNGDSTSDMLQEAVVEENDNEQKQLDSIVSNSLGKPSKSKSNEAKYFESIIESQETMDAGSGLGRQYDIDMNNDEPNESDYDSDIQAITKGYQDDFDSRNSLFDDSSERQDYFKEIQDRGNDDLKDLKADLAASEKDDVHVEDEPVNEESGVKIIKGEKGDLSYQNTDSSKSQLILKDYKWDEDVSSGPKAFSSEIRTDKGQYQGILDGVSRLTKKKNSESPKSHINLSGLKQKLKELKYIGKESKKRKISETITMINSIEGQIDDLVRAGGKKFSSRGSHKNKLDAYDELSNPIARKKKIFKELVNSNDNKPGEIAISESNFRESWHPQDSLDVDGQLRHWGKINRYEGYDSFDQRLNNLYNGFSNQDKAPLNTERDMYIVGNLDEVEKKSLFSPNDIRQREEMVNENILSNQNVDTDLGEEDENPQTSAATSMRQNELLAGNISSEVNDDKMSGGNGDDENVEEPNLHTIADKNQGLQSVSNSLSKKSTQQTFSSIYPIVRNSYYEERRDMPLSFQREHASKHYDLVAEAKRREKLAYPGYSPRTSVVKEMADQDRSIRLDQAATLINMQKQEAKDDLQRLKDVTQSGLQNLFANAVAKQQRFIDDISGSTYYPSLPASLPGMVQQEPRALDLEQMSQERLNIIPNVYQQRQFSYMQQPRQYFSRTDFPSYAMGYERNVPSRARSTNIPQSPTEMTDNPKRKSDIMSGGYFNLGDQYIFDNDNEEDDDDNDDGLPLFQQDEYDEH